MKLSLDYKKLHLRFFCGIGFARFVLTRACKIKDADRTAQLKTLGKDIKKHLKEYKRANGRFNLCEIEQAGGVKINIGI